VLSIYPHMTFSFVKENHIFSEIWLANDLRRGFLLRRKFQAFWSGNEPIGLSGH